MDLIQVFKSKLRNMALEDVKKSSAEAPDPQRDSKGIALLMVIAAISVLSFLVTEFTYVAQLNQKLAFDSLDQIKAHYLAKSGYKLSLLRLKAYQTVKGLVGGSGGGSSSGGSNPPAGGGAGGGGGAPSVPSAILDQIWAFPFMYPIPTNIPGLTPGDKDQIAKFEKASNLDGSFSAIIESDSSRLNINLILAGFAPSPTPSASASPSPGASPSPSPQPSPNPGGSPTPTPSASFNPDQARKSLQDYLQNIIQTKEQQDPDFQSEYRDFRVEDFMDNVVAWADPTYERKQSGMGSDSIPMKRAPFYSLSELHMLPGMDDQLYDLFTSALTVSRTPGINLNTMQEPVLRALAPQMTDQEVKDFFTFRDNGEEDNHFKSADDFYKYLSNSVAAFKDQKELDKYKDDLSKRNIRLLTDESEFKITVRATVNETVRTLEAWVTLGPSTPISTGGGTGTGNKSTAPSPRPSPSPGPSGAPNQAPDSGLKINFVRIS